MDKIAYTFGIILLIFIYNKTYFYFNKKKVVFYDYFQKFIYFSLIVFGLLFFFRANIYLTHTFIQSLIGLYLITFFSIFFTVSLKSYESPTDLMYKFLKKKTNFKKLYLFLKKKKIVSSRIKDLKNQKLIYENKSIISLSSLGLNFCRVYFFLMKFFNIKCKG